MTCVECWEKSMKPIKWIGLHCWINKTVQSGLYKIWFSNWFLSSRTGRSCDILILSETWWDGRYYICSKETTWDQNKLTGNQKNVNLMLITWESWYCYKQVSKSLSIDFLDFWWWRMDSKRKTWWWPFDDNLVTNWVCSTPQTLMTMFWSKSRAFRLHWFRHGRIAARRRCDQSSRRRSDN